MIAAQPVHARIDRDGRLVEADADLVALNTRAGGAIGRPLAVPQLAMIVRLARRLDILVSRGVTLADREHDLDAWVRAQPDGEGVRLTLSQIRERAPWRPAIVAADPAFGVGADWHWATDAMLQVTTLSPSAPLTPEHVVGRPLAGLFDLSAGNALSAALERREDFAEIDARIAEDGLPLRLSAIARHDEEGGFAGYRGAAWRVEAPVKPSGSGLTDTFTARLDRALRGPLGQIIANADSINARSDGPLTDDYAGYAADIANAGRHLLALVDDLVDLEAIERPDFRVEIEPIDLADLARRAAGLFAVRAADAAVTIERPAIDASVMAQGEFRRTLQILVNLIGNAIRYAPRGSVVRIAVASDGATASVAIVDPGKGIAPGDHARVFEKFARIDANEAGGNGLGLYIARRLARAMAGDLTLESVAGNGARFTLTLPT